MTKGKVHILSFPTGTTFLINPKKSKDELKGTCMTEELFKELNPHLAFEVGPLLPDEKEQDSPAENIVVP